MMIIFISPIIRLPLIFIADIDCHASTFSPPADAAITSPPPLADYFATFHYAFHADFRPMAPFFRARQRLIFLLLCCLLLLRFTFRRCDMLCWLSRRHGYATLPAALMSLQPSAYARHGGCRFRAMPPLSDAMPLLRARYYLLPPIISILILIDFDFHAASFSLPPPLPIITDYFASAAAHAYDAAAR